jgi:hypothetical protein
MKKSFYFLVLLLISLSLATCASDDDGSDCAGVECLPEATQTGEGTFGCLVNGVPYVDNSGRFNCYYQLINNEYSFNIGVSRRCMNIRQMRIGSLDRSIVTNERIPLNEYLSGEFHAEISYENQTEGAWTKTMEDGYIMFTRYDANANVVSATFEFTIVDEFGNTYEITEGRFDARFTR